METRTPVPTSGIRGWCVCIVRAAGAEHFFNRIVLCIARRLGCAKSCARVSSRRLLSHNGYGTTFLIFIIIIIIIVIIILSRPGANPMLCTSICVGPSLSVSLSGYVKDLRVGISEACAVMKTQDVILLCCFLLRLPLSFSGVAVLFLYCFLPMIIIGY